MHKTIYNREDFKTVLPQLEKRFNSVDDRAEKLEKTDEEIKTEILWIEELLDEIPKDTGWNPLSLSSEFTAYTQDLPPLYRRIGNTVYIQGAVSPTDTITGGTDVHVIATLPLGFRPTSELDYDNPVSTLQQGSGLCVWFCRVQLDGKVTFARYRNESGYANVGTSTWLPFTITFMTDDDFPIS